MHASPPRATRVFAVVLGLFVLMGQALAPAGEHPRRRYIQPRAYTATAEVVPVDSGPRLLGSFVPTPTMVVRGNGVVGGGYSPFGMTGDYTLSLYGPFSPSRYQAAPIVLRPAGYGTSAPAALGVSFSTPNLPAASRVIYPTRANVANGFREQRTPPWWDSGFGWIDQN